MVTMPVEVYTDGSCLKNPGAGGWAYIIRYWDSQNPDDLPQAGEIEASQGFRLTTNNRMEILAAVEALKRLISLRSEDPNWSEVRQINLKSDSEYLCKAINQRWLQKWRENNWMTSGFQGRKPQPVKNKDLWEQVISLQDQMGNTGINFTITWVKGHDGNEYNERCDKMAVAASSDGTKHIIDMEYETTTTAYNRR